MPSGIIKSLNAQGIGFISSPGMVSLVFSAAMGNQPADVPLRVGDAVTYIAELDTRGRGPRAIHVRRVP